MSAALQVFQPDDAGADTVGDVIALYLSHGKKPGRSERAWADCEHVLRKFDQAHGEVAIAKARPYHLRWWVDGREEYRSDWTKKRVIATVQRAFNWAQKLGVIDRNPFWGISHQAGPRRRPMEAEEWRKLMRHTDAVFRRLLVFLRWTGARPGEMAAANWTDLELDVARQEGFITLREHKTSRKTGEARLIPLHPVVVKMLVWMDRHELLPCQDAIFVNWKGNRWHRSALSLRMQRLRRRAEVSDDAKLYCIRHQWVTEALVAGCELKAVSEMAGHKTTRMTEYYAHLDRKKKFLLDVARRAMPPRPAKE